MTPKAMPTLHEVLGPPGGRPSSPPRSFCCLPVSWPPGDPTKIAPLLVVVGSDKLLVNNGKFVCGGVVICGVLVEVKIGGIDSVVDCDLKVLDVLESESVSDSDDVVDVVLELVVRAGGGEKTGGVAGGGGGKDVESSSSSSSSTALNLSSSSSSLPRSEAVPSTTASVRPQITSSSSCCLADTWTAARCTLLRRALGSRQDQHNGSSTCCK